MQQPQLKSIEETLRSMRDRLVTQIDSELEAIQDVINPAGNLSNVPVHLGDAASTTIDSDITVLEQERDILALVMHALQRLEDGSYGRCEACGQEIPTERLELIPYTPCCVQCMRKREKAGERSSARDVSLVRLFGFEAIEFAAVEGLTLHKSADSIDGPAANLSVAEAEAIASDRPDLIWLEVTNDQYQYRRNLQPGVPPAAAMRMNKGPGKAL